MPPFVSYLVFGYVIDSLGKIVRSANLKVTTSVGSKTYTTNSNGIFMYDLAEIGYTSGETVSVDVTDAFNNELKAHTFIVSGFSLNEDITLAIRTSAIDVVGYVSRQIIHSVGNKPITRDNPLPIEILGQSDVIDLVNNPATTWTITRGDGQPDNETVTMANGDIYKRTFTYTNDIMTARSAWVRQ